MRFFAERMKMVVEPTGCLAAAALLEGAIDLRGQRVGVIVSGGNVDLARYAALLRDGGLTRRHRQRDSHDHRRRHGRSRCQPRHAQDPTTPTSARREQVDKLLARPAAVQQRRASRCGGRPLDYAVHAAFVPVAAGGIDGARGEPEAAVLTTAYLLQGRAAGARGRCASPSTAGPGSASIWLHLGALGPKRVVVPDDGTHAAAAVCGGSDNPLSWFEHFDLVFIDPPHTGWSITASDAARKKMLSVDGDVDALAEVMRVLADAAQALGLAGVPGRRELRHHTRRRRWPTSCRRWAWRCRA